MVFNEIDETVGFCGVYIEYWQNAFDTRFSSRKKDISRFSQSKRVVELKKFKPFISLNGFINFYLHAEFVDKHGIFTETWEVANLRRCLEQAVDLVNPEINMRLMSEAAPVVLSKRTLAALRALPDTPEYRGPPSELRKFTPALNYALLSTFMPRRNVY